MNNTNFRIILSDLVTAKVELSEVLNRINTQTRERRTATSR